MNGFNQKFQDIYQKITEDAERLDTMKLQEDETIKMIETIIMDYVQIRPARYEDTCPELYEDSVQKAAKLIFQLQNHMKSDGNPVATTK